MNTKSVIILISIITFFLSSCTYKNENRETSDSVVEMTEEEKREQEEKRREREERLAREQEKRDSIRNEIKKQTIGVWLDDLQAGIGYRIRKDPKRGLLLEFIEVKDRYGTNSSNGEPLRKEKRKGRTLFIPVDFFEDYYVLEPNGNLSAYDTWGHIVTYKRIE